MPLPAANTRLSFTGKVRASREGTACLQIKLKDGGKEIGRCSSAKCGVEERELRVECAAAGATAVTALCRFSQETAGARVWFSDLRLLARGPE